MKKTKLFEDFDPVSAKAWKQKIQVDLKGAEYNKALLWESPEGINVKPFYHSDTDDFTIAVEAPEQWFIGESIFIHELSGALHAAKKALTHGAESIFFKSLTTFDTALFLKGLKAVAAPIYIHLDFLDPAFKKELINGALQNNINLRLSVDIVGHLAREGNWFKDLTTDYTALAKLQETNYRHIVSVDATLYANAGATLTQQLAYALSHANEYLNAHNNSEQKKEAFHITVNVSVGTNYFFEIAKLRALRRLFETVGEAYDFESTIDIVSKPLIRNKTIYDYNTNMLRTTTECMSAVLGGSDVVVNEPYDVIYHKANAFGQRIARNQLIILKEESYFDAVCNPADGSYYIEQLTAQLAEKALGIFKDLESSGGFVTNLIQGNIQRKIKESAQAEQTRFDNQEITLLGSNKHPNPDDRMKDNLELYPFVKRRPRKTLLEPIIPKRLAEKLEQNRLEKE